MFELDDVNYDELCKKEKKRLGIPKDIEYDVVTEKVSMSYSRYRDLIIEQNLKPALTKKNKVILKMILKIYFRFILILKTIIIIAGIGFLLHRWILFAFFAAILFCLIYLLPDDKDDITTLIYEKIKKL